MRTTRTLTLALLATTLIGGSALAEMKPEEQIQTRQAGYKFMGWNMGKIKANLQGEYNAAQVQAAAAAIAGIANSGMGALYGPGTDKAIGDVKTRVKPELFTDREGVGEVARNFIAAANNLNTVAAAGDPASTMDAFGQLGRSCKGCHDKYRKD